LKNVKGSVTRRRSRTTSNSGSCPARNGGRGGRWAGRDADRLAEVTGTQPNPGKIRRAVTAIKGVLAPVAAGLSAATSAEVQEWARTAIDQLGAAL
jgi:hypothetical protein